MVRWEPETGGHIAIESLKWLKLMRMTYGEPSEAENRASYTKQLSYKYKGHILEIKRAIQTITLHEVNQIYWRYGESSIAVGSRSNKHRLETKLNEVQFYEKSDGEGSSKTKAGSRNWFMELKE